MAVLTAVQTTLDAHTGFSGGVPIPRVLEYGHPENRGVRGGFDKEWVRPSFLPQLAETALGAMRLWSFRAKPLPA